MGFPIKGKEPLLSCCCYEDGSRPGWLSRITRAPCVSRNTSAEEMAFFFFSPFAPLYETWPFFSPSVFCFHCYSPHGCFFQAKLGSFVTLFCVCFLLFFPFSRFFFLFGPLIDISGSDSLCVASWSI